MGLNTNKINIDQIDLSIKLGAGMFGTTYLGIYKGKKYAVKIEKIAEKDIGYNLKVQDWRDIEFSLNFANLFPNQFIYLYSYDIIDNCKHIQEYPSDKIPDHLPKLVQIKLREKSQSTFCIRKVYSLIDTTFSSIFNEMSKKQFYSFLGQISWIYYLITQHGYTHNDFHGQNVGIVYTGKKSTIKMENINFPTAGICCKAIDFGMVLNDKYPMNGEERKLHKLNKTNEILRLIKRMIYWDNNGDFYKLINWDVTLNKLIKKNFLYAGTQELSRDPTNRFYIFQILYPKEFQEIYWTYTGEKTNKDVCYPKCKIDLEDFIYMLEHKSEPKKIIKLCVNKIKQMKGI
jgi:hypothetical protein